MEESTDSTETKALASTSSALFFPAFASPTSKPQYKPSPKAIDPDTDARPPPTGAVALALDFSFQVAETKEADPEPDPDASNSDDLVFPAFAVAHLPFTDSIDPEALD